MAERIVTGSDGRKYITNEPLLHERMYTKAELDAAITADRQRISSHLRHIAEHMVGEEGVAVEWASEEILKFK